MVYTNDLAPQRLERFGGLRTSYRNAPRTISHPLGWSGLPDYEERLLGKFYRTAIIRMVWGGLADYQFRGARKLHRTVSHPKGWGGHQRERKPSLVAALPREPRSGPRLPGTSTSADAWTQFPQYDWHLCARAPTESSSKYLAV